MLSRVWALCALAVGLMLVVVACGDNAKTVTRKPTANAAVTEPTASPVEPTSSSVEPEPASTTQPQSSPTPQPEPTAVPAPTAQVPPGEDLEAVDWANHTYLLAAAMPDPQCEPPLEVTLIDGKAQPSTANGGLSYGLGKVVYGSMGMPAEPVAVVELVRVGAGSWPSVVLASGANGPRTDLLGTAAGGRCYTLNPEAHEWSVQTIELTEGGLLVMTGVGWDKGAHCCPDLAVVVEVALSDDRVLYEVEHTEVPR